MSDATARVKVQPSTGRPGGRASGTLGARLEERSSLKAVSRCSSWMVVSKRARSSPATVGFCFQSAPLESKAGADGARSGSKAVTSASPATRRWVIRDSPTSEKAIPGQPWRGVFFGSTTEACAMKGGRRIRRPRSAKDSLRGRLGGLPRRLIRGSRATSGNGTTAAVETVPVGEAVRAVPRSGSRGAPSSLRRPSAADRYRPGDGHRAS